MCSRISDEYFLGNPLFSFLREKGWLVRVPEAGCLSSRGTLAPLFPLYTGWVQDCYGI